MIARGAKTVPLSFRFPAEEGREDGWGRFERLHPRGGRVVTRFRLEEGDRVHLSFSACGETFEDAPARVDRHTRDLDGYFEADVWLEDEVVVRRLGAALRGLLQRAAPAEPR